MVLVRRWSVKNSKGEKKSQIPTTKLSLLVPTQYPMSFNQH